MSYPSDYTAIKDPNGQLWVIGASNNGTLFRTAATAGTVAGHILRDSDGILRTLGLNAAGQLSVSAGGDAHLANDSRVYCSNNGGLWKLFAITGGAIVTKRVGSAPPGPAIGVCDPPNDGYPLFTQPGGPGTITFPQQQGGGPSAWDGIPNELGQGVWTAGCGHWFNEWLVQSETVLGVQSAMICCPICAYVQAIVTPYALIHTDSYYIIFA